MASIRFSSIIKAWTRSLFTVPWKPGRVSIHDFLSDNIDPESERLRDSGQTLPDEEFVHAQSQIRYAAGAFDGAAGHHGVLSVEDRTIDTIYNALRSLLKRRSKKNMSTFYALILSHGALKIVDPLIEKVVNDQSIDHRRLHKISHWLALRAPDREPVKVAMLLFGLFPRYYADPIILTLGRHDEFTLYAAAALEASLEDADRNIWLLAQMVDGWGRIHTVERLADTEKPDIKRWMVREGFRNTIMNEYLAYVCATSGELVSELRAPDPDDELIIGAGEIIDALILGGPAEDMRHYEDGAEATDLYLRLAKDRDLSLGAFQTIVRIRDFASNDEEDWQDFAGDWSVGQRGEIVRISENIMARQGWRARAEAALASNDETAFWEGNEVAKTLGVDTWEIVFGRLKNTDAFDYWFELMRTDDPERIDRLIAYAEGTLPLDELASGPSNALGLSPEYADHFALDIIVQELGRFPGKGWNLIRASLQSPVVRNRNMAINALAEWGREHWPSDAQSCLEAARDAEKEENVKKHISAQLSREEFDT